MVLWLDWSYTQMTFGCCCCCSSCRYPTMPTLRAGEPYVVSTSQLSPKTHGTTCTYTKTIHHSMIIITMTIKLALESVEEVV